MNLKPLKDRVVVELPEAEEVSPGGIIIPEKARDKGTVGKVIYAGKDVEEVKPGYRVIIGKYAGAEIIFEGKEYVIMKEEDILSILCK